MRRTGLLALAAALLTAAAGTALAADPVKIRIGWSTHPTHLAPIMTMKTDIYKHYGKSYVVEPVRMRGSGPMLTALAAGEVEIAGFSYQAFALGVINAKIDVRVIADVIASREPYRDNGFWAHKGEIKKITDLKGKNIAVNARGSGVDAALRKMMLDNGLKDGEDYQIVEVNFAAMLPALESKRVDVSFLVQPFDMRAEKSGKYDQVFTLRDSMGEQQTVVWAALDGWLQKNRAAVLDFMEDHLRFRQWIYDPANRTETVAMVAKATRIDGKEFEEWVFTKYDYARDAGAKVDAATLQRNIDDLHKYNVLPGTFDVKPYVDMSYAEEAAKRLK